MNKKVFIFLADGFEESEAIIPIDILRRAGIECIMVSITDSITVTSSHNVKVVADSLFDMKECLNGDAIILPGGIPGTINLLNHDGVKDIILEYNKNNKIIAAICAAPTILGEMGLLKGKKAICYPSMTEKLFGAIVEDEKCIKDDNIITSKGLGAAMNFALKLVEELIDSETMEKIKHQIVF